MNKATLIGRVGKDPESRNLREDEKVVSFSLATEESWRDKQTGERKSKTEWHNIVIFNQGLGKIASQYVTKGSRICVEGKITTRKWKDRDDNDRYTTEIVLDKFGGYLELLSDKSEGASSGGGSPAGSGASKPAPARHADLDDDIPF